MNTFNNHTGRREITSKRNLVVDSYDDDYDNGSEEYEYEDCCCISSLIHNLNFIQVISMLCPPRFDFFFSLKNLLLVCIACFDYRLTFIHTSFRDPKVF